MRQNTSTDLKILSINNKCLKVFDKFYITTATNT